jgi:putative endonuclease
MTWFVYIILCSDNSLYTGITTDIARRFGQHFNGRGAKYFRGRKPEKLFYLEGGHNRSTAGKREALIKRLKTSDKYSLVCSVNNSASSFPRLPDLYRAISSDITPKNRLLLAEPDISDENNHNNHLSGR